MIITQDTLAAVDLGSNSFHMIIARVVEGQLQIIDRLKDMVRLGGGLDEANNLTPQAQERALAALSRFGERVREMPRGSVRAVGTNTLRKARNAREFMQRAEHALGHPIEIISGREEGRLVYLGVAHDIFEASGERRLVVDIGGGSTEAILGQRFDVLACESLYMGCVSFSQRYFSDGALTAERFAAAVLGARQELRPLENVYPALGWSDAIGSSGTIKAIQAVLADENLTHGEITLEGMLRLRERVIQCKHVSKLQLQGLNAQRAPVFAGGLAVLIGVFESLGVTRMQVSDFALREGAIYDLHGRSQDVDVRDATITSMAARYYVDGEHAERVWRAARLLLDQVKEAWGLEDRAARKILRWACQVHEIGLAVAHSRHHKHGSYLVENSDMPGFSRQDHQLLWALIRTHRRQFKPHRFEGLTAEPRERGPKLAIVLRLAVLLTRSRAAASYPEELIAQAGPGRIQLIFPEDWLEHAPLMREDLRQEKAYLKDADVKLKF